MKIAEVCAIDTTVRNLLLPLIDELIDRGHEVHAVCSPGLQSSLLKAEGYIVNEINIDRKIGFSNFSTLVNLIKYFRGQRFDIVHVHTPVAAVLGRIAARIAGVPMIVYTAHGFYFHENMSWLKFKIFVAIEKLIARTCTDVIFTQSGEDYAYAKKTGIIGKKGIWHIGNGVDLTRFDPEIVGSSTIGVKQALSLGPHNSVISFIGRMVQEKGIIDLLKAFCIVNLQFPDCRLLLIGDTLESDRDQEVKQQMAKVIVENNLKDKVIFCGFRNDIPELLSISDVFVLPSYREGMPRSIIEAMAMKKPVVATDIRGCREEVVDGETGYIVPVNNSDKLASAILTILENPALTTEMGIKAREKALKDFDERAVIEKQLAVWQNFQFTSA